MNTSRRMLTAKVCITAICACATQARADLVWANFGPELGTTVSGDAWVIITSQPDTEYETAMPFTPDVSFTLDAIVVPVFTFAETGGYTPPPPAGTFFGDSMQVAVYADDGGQPGALLEIIDRPDSLAYYDQGDPMPTPVSTDFSGKTLLHAGETYWVGLAETESTALAWVGADFMPPTVKKARYVGTTEWVTLSGTRAGLQVYGTPVPQCEADVTGDDVVDIDDLLAVISVWGACGSACPPACAGDVVPTCAVDIDDLLAVIGAWGACP